MFLAQANKWNNVPVIFGTNKNEGTIFVPTLPLVVPGTSFPPSTADLEKGAPTKRECSWGFIFLFHCFSCVLTCLLSCLVMAGLLWRCTLCDLPKPALPHFFVHYTDNQTAITEATMATMERYPLSNYDNNKWVRRVAVPACLLSRIGCWPPDGGGFACVVVSELLSCCSPSPDPPPPPFFFPLLPLRQHRAAAIMTDWFFTCATRRAATAISENGGDVYLYQFTQKLVWPPLLSASLLCPGVM